MRGGKKCLWYHLILKNVNIGFSLSKEISHSFGISLDCQVNKIPNSLIFILIQQSILSSPSYYKKNRFHRNRDLRLLAQFNHYRGRRWLQGLPLHGQRTKTNAKTRKKFKIY